MLTLSRFLLVLLAFFGILLPVREASAILEIQVTGGASSRIPVALVPFQSAPGTPKPELMEIVGADLMRSGQFSLINTAGMQQPSEPSQIDYTTWKTKGADALVIGQVARAPDGRYEIRFRLMDAVRQTQLAGLSFHVGQDQWRAAAHRIADVVYEKLTGLPGAFSSRIAYINKRGKRFELMVADADGLNPQSVVRSGEPLISPAFAPDGVRIAYVSFEDRKPVVYVQSLRDGSRRAVAAFKGSNSAPTWSPDGTRLAVTLTRDAGSQIYLINADGTGLSRLTSSSAIDTEPVFSPDGNTLYFTSDRGGAPQIYKVPVAGGEVKRVSFEGGYNVSADVSPDGKYLTYVQRDGGRFRVVLHEIASGQVRPLTDSAHDESPSFAPNGQMVLYATLHGARGVLGSVSLDGRTRARLSEPGSDTREPAWGP